MLKKNAPEGATVTYRFGFGGRSGCELETALFVEVETGRVFDLASWKDRRELHSRFGGKTTAPREGWFERDPRDEGVVLVGHHRTDTKFVFDHVQKEVAEGFDVYLPYKLGVDEATPAVICKGHVIWFVRPDGVGRFLLDARGGALPPVERKAVRPLSPATGTREEYTCWVGNEYGPVGNLHWAVHFQREGFPPEDVRAGNYGTSNVLYRTLGVVPHDGRLFETMNFDNCPSSRLVLHEVADLDALAERKGWLPLGDHVYFHHTRGRDLVPYPGGNDEVKGVRNKWTCQDPADGPVAIAWRPRGEGFAEEARRLAAETPQDGEQWRQLVRDNGLVSYSVCLFDGGTSPEEIKSEMLRRLRPEGNYPLREQWDDLFGWNNKIPATLLA